MSQELLPGTADEPTWYKDAVIYQAHVRTFQDSNGDGIGDFRGLTARLPYLRDLGVTALWLLPFYPSPLRDDGYDIAEYTNVHPAYGTLADFKAFLKAAHGLGLRVITELVINHTSDQHAWFQKARRAPRGSLAREFYVWSDTQALYREARIIFKDFETSNWTWDDVAGQYYWHRFYAHQPDLNFDNPAVLKAVLKVMSFWLELGVDGMRLDAVPYLIERDGTSCENLPETHAILKQLRAEIERRYPGRMLLAEANQWPEDAVAYFGQGDECHMAFHFPVMPRMFMAVRMEDRYPIIDILAQTPAIPEGAQWATFLRNHDELTLEMVTDEERDYMYRVYAHDPQMRINLGIRRRLAPLVENDRKRVELLNGLLFSLPGTPVVYYGDEIGMGDNVWLGDRNGVRTPMQWNADRNAGFSRANPQRLYLPVIIDPVNSYESVNVVAQHDSPHSLLWWMRRLIALRKRYRAFGRGTLEFLSPPNRKVLAFVRRYEGEEILVVANLSRHAQFVELDLSPWKDRVPMELFGHTDFPAVGDGPYVLTLGPHAFFWFSLEDRGTADSTQTSELPLVKTTAAWPDALQGRVRTAVEEVLPGFLQQRRWFGGKARKIRTTTILEAVPISAGSNPVLLALAQVDYTEGDPETYALALGHALGKKAEELAAQMGSCVIARFTTRQGDGLLYEAMGERAFGRALLDAIARRRHFKGAAGEIMANPSRAFREVMGEGEVPEPKLLRGEQSNSSMLFGEKAIFKLFRRAESGINPDLEIGTFLTEQARFPQIAPVAGWIDYQPTGAREAITLAILQGFVPNEGDAWQLTVDSVGRFLDRVMARAEHKAAPLPAAPLLELARGETPQLAQELIGTYLESAWLLGLRTAEMHLALGSFTDDPAFVPEAFTPFYQRSLYQSMRNLTEDVFHFLKRRLPSLPAEVKRDAEVVAAAQPEVLRRFRSMLEKKIAALRTRHHGDYHLGQVLWTGRDFVILDFEGEPARALSTRRIKKSPLKDVAGMIRSFHYAAHHGLATQRAKGAVPAEAAAVFATWAEYWYVWVSASFLRAYVSRAGDAPFLPQDPEQLRGLFTVYLLEKAVYELGYELNNRPEWVHLPLRGIRQLLG